MVRLSDDKITFSERRIYGETAVEYAPWLSYKFPGTEIIDKEVYDEDGLPEGYPWMRYDVNAQYPQAKEVWKQKFEANIVAGFAVRETGYSSFGVRRDEVRFHKRRSRDMVQRFRSQDIFDPGSVGKHSGIRLY